jgi:hypothetical protein
MGYGSYLSNEKASQGDSLVSILSDKSGYARENFGEYELEVKIDIVSEPPLTLGEKLDYKSPYVKDKILEDSISLRNCYAFIDKTSGQMAQAFTKIIRGSDIKFKLKEKTEYLEKKEIIMLKRKEKNLVNLTGEHALQIIDSMFIEARKNNSYLDYIGEFQKQNKEIFIFNQVSGRIFVVETNICKAESNKLFQLEIEYYGKINGFPNINSPEEDMADLAGIVMENSNKKYSFKNSTLTKFEWVAGKYRR